MRRGTSSLGRDVPSEREINRLAARSDEEYWMFERMDEERRQKENYRSRLMEDHEVPDWAYSKPDPKDTKGKGFDYESANITGKRRRKEVVYADTLSELQWMKAVETGEEPFKHSTRGKQTEHLPPVTSDLIYNSAKDGKKVIELKSKPETVPSEYEKSSIKLSVKRHNLETANSPSSEFVDAGTTSKGRMLSWKPHKRKRSSLVE